MAKQSVYTVRELAERWGVTRQRVHQLLAAAGVQPQDSGFGNVKVISEKDLRVVEAYRAA